MLDKKIFSDFQGEVRKAYYQFSVWLHVNNELARLENHDLVWEMILTALEQAYILAIARILDPPYYDKKKKEEPRLSLKFVLENLNDPVYTKQVEQRIEEAQKTNDQSVGLVQDYRPFIAHNPLNTERKQKIKSVDYLFDELRKIIKEIGQRINCRHPGDPLEKENIDDLVAQSTRRLFEAVLKQNKEDEDSISS